MPLFVILYYLLKMALMFEMTQHYFISFLNVGQGDSFVLNIPHYGQLMIDTGSDYQSAYMSAKYSMFPVCNLRYIFITHYDKDHSGGLSRLSQYCNRKTTYDDLSYGDSLTVGELQLYILNPARKGYERNENNDSLVIFMKKGNFEALLTGDAGIEVIESSARELIDKKMISGDLEVYKVSHHGSLHNSNPDIFGMLNPRYCVISVGKNMYGHPDTTVLENIERSECRVYRTDKEGSIMIYF